VFRAGAGATAIGMAAGKGARATALGWEAADKSIYFLRRLSACTGAALPELPLRLIFLHGPNFSTRQLFLS
jgi:hypothetical protein